MTTTIPIADIQINPRMRQDNGDLESLQNAMNERGLLQPIGVQQLNESPLTFSLLWGGRRLEAAKNLGWKSIEAKIAPSMQSYEASEIEFMENWERKSMTWQEEAVGLARIHAERTRHGAKTGEAWGQRETGRLLGISVGNVNYTLKVAERIASGDAEITNAINMAEALRILLRRKDAEMQSKGKPVPQRTETYFNPKDFQQSIPQGPRAPAPAPAPSVPPPEFVLARINQIPTNWEGFGLVGSFNNKAAWCLSQGVYQGDYPEGFQLSLVYFRDLSIDTGYPFQDCMKIFTLFWNRKQPILGAAKAPLYSDNTAFSRVLYGPKALTDGWWEYILEALAPRNAVIFWQPEEIDGVDFCLRRHINCYAYITDEQTAKLSANIAKYNATLEIVYPNT